MKYALFVLFLSIAYFLPAQQPSVKPVRFSLIANNLYEIMDGRGARGGVFIHETGVMVIDAKQDEASVNQVLEEIKKLTDKPIKYLINTHSDANHVFGNQFFPTSATIVAHENCRKEFYHAKRDGSASDWLKPELAIFIPSVTFSDKMRFYMGNTPIELYYFGIGHTTGDLVVYFPEDKIAFIGDQIFVGRPQLIHSYKGGNSFEHVKTLTRMLASIDAEKFYSGHSDAVDRLGIEKHISEMKQLQANVQELKNQQKTLAEVTSAFESDKSRLIESIYNELN